MFKYLLGRLLLILPTVWLISSVVFLVSRLIPGTYADNFAESREGSVGAINITDRAAYLKDLASTGLDKPLFYFSWRTQAQPDTLHRVFPVLHQTFLQNLISRYGNWPSITAYYQSLLSLQKEAGQLSAAGPPYGLVLAQTASLFQTAEPQRIKATFRQLHQTTRKDSGNWQKAVIFSEQRFEQLVKEATPYKNILPALRLHGLDNQYHAWFTSILNNNWGYSFRDAQPVTAILQQAIQNTLLLLISSLILIFALAIELSLILCQAKKRNWRRIILPVLYIIESIPLFIITLFVLVLLASTGHLNIGSGVAYHEADNWLIAFGDQLSHLLLPMLCLVLASLPYVTTQFYQALQQVLTSEYITTAQAKGLSEKRVLRRHAFRNILLPVITLFTGYLPALISGAVVIEVIFTIPGTGRLLAESVSARDFPVVIGLVLFVAILKAGSHLLADFLYFTADPRTRQKIT